MWSLHKTSCFLLLSNLPLSLSLQITWSVFKQLLWDFTDCSDSRWELWLTARLHPVHLPLPLTPPPPPPAHTMWLLTPAGWPLTSPSPLKALSTPSKLSKPCKNRILTLKSWTASSRERRWQRRDQTILVNYLGFGQNDDFLINSKVKKSNRLIFRILNISVDFFSITGNEKSEVIITHCQNVVELDLLA